MSHHLSTVYFVALVSMCALLAVVDYLTGNRLSALLALTFAGLVLVYARRRSRIASRLSMTLEYLMLGGLMAISLAALWWPQQLAIQFVYLVPFVALYVMPRIAATGLLLVFSLLFLTLLGFGNLGSERIPVFFTYLLCLFLAVAHFYLGSLKNAQFEPVRATDDLTQASSPAYLNTDLDKEIQRAEREGTSLVVMMMAPDLEAQQLPHRLNKEAVLNQLGELIQGQLRLFDSFYRIDQFRFVLVLPHTSTAEAMRKAESLRVAAKSLFNHSEPAFTVSLGVSGLNVGDNADSLIDKATLALHKAQDSGSDSTQSYVD